MEPNRKSQAVALRSFLPSKSGAAVIGVLGLGVLSAALFLRYGIIQNRPLGIACEDGEQSLICTFRLAAIMLFARGVFGWTALIAAGINLWRPNVVAFGIGVIFALLGLELYNTRVSALAAALLVLSLARPSPAGK